MPSSSLSRLKPSLLRFQSSTPAQSVFQKSRVSASVYVTGPNSDNAFQIRPDGVITEIIDYSSDGAGNGLSAAGVVAVDGVGDVYLAGGWSSNAFKVDMVQSAVPALSPAGLTLLLLLLALAGLLGIRHLHTAMKPT